MSRLLASALGAEEWGRGPRRGLSKPAARFGTRFRCASGRDHGPPGPAPNVRIRRGVVCPFTRGFLAAVRPASESWKTLGGGIPTHGAGGGDCSIARAAMRRRVGREIGPPPRAVALQRPASWACGPLSIFRAGDPVGGCQGQITRLRRLAKPPRDLLGEHRRRFGWMMPTIAYLGGTTNAATSTRRRRAELRLTNPS
jgi:hypothetical protein